MSEPLKIVITANGEGSRMKALSPIPKHLLYYGGKRIIDCIVDAMEPFGHVKVFGFYPGGKNTENWMVCGSTESRKAQLELIQDWKNVLIVDCDVIPVFYFEDKLFNGPFGCMMKLTADADGDAIWYFDSDNPKYGGLEMEKNGTLAAAKERGQGQKYRASGLYFLKGVGATVDRMTDPNSIASGMIGARMIFENTFIRVGDPEDYLNALK